VLADFIDSGAAPVARLTEVFVRPRKATSLSMRTALTGAKRATELRSELRKTPRWHFYFCEFVAKSVRQTPASSADDKRPRSGCVRLASCRTRQIQVNVAEPSSSRSCRTSDDRQGCQPLSTYVPDPTVLSRLSLWSSV
jgi:hypothetical protein